MNKQNISRSEIRFFKQKGLDKKIINFVDTIIKDCKNEIEPFKNYRFNYGDTEYDIEPIISLIPMLFNEVSDGIHKFESTMSKKIVLENKNIIKSPILIASSILNNIYTDIENASLKINLIRTINICRHLELYHYDLGGYNYEILEDEKSNLFKRSNEDDEFTLSQIYESALSVNLYKLFDEDDILSDFLTSYFLIIGKCENNKKDESSDIFNLIRILMEYFLISKINNVDDFPVIFSITGNLENDVKKINKNFLQVLEYINNNNLKNNSFIMNIIDINDEEKFSLILYKQVFLYRQLDLIYKVSIVNTENMFNDLKKENTNRIAIEIKNNKKITKENEHLKKQLERKNKEISLLNNKINILNNDNKTNDYISKINTLNLKLKKVQNKYEGASTRVKNLEEKLQKQEDYIAVCKDDTNISSELIQDNINTINKINISDYNDKISQLKDKHFLIVGGNCNFFSRFKNILPNAKHIDIVNEGCNFTVPNSTDCILNMTKFTTHSHIKRAQSQAPTNTPIIKISTYQIDDIINTVYNILEKK